jgi:hypothetical protein
MKPRYNVALFAMVCFRRWVCGLRFIDQGYVPTLLAGGL